VLRQSGAALVLLLILLSSCSSDTPKNLQDSCAIFDEKSDWYADSLESYNKWGVPVHVQLAIIYQESRFVDDAKPPRDTVLWVIPWGRKSSAYGYGQVMDSTWDWYRESTGNSWADRDDFTDVVDFIGWYGDRSNKVAGIAKTDAYNQYLAYHEGHAGYRKSSYLKKKWLLKVARKVEAQARRYQKQLQQCQERLNQGSWFSW